MQLPTTKGGLVGAHIIGVKKKSRPKGASSQQTTSGGLGQGLQLGGGLQLQPGQSNRTTATYSRNVVSINYRRHVQLCW